MSPKSDEKPAVDHVEGVRADEVEAAVRAALKDTVEMSAAEVAAAVARADAASSDVDADANANDEQPT